MTNARFFTVKLKKVSKKSETVPATQRRELGQRRTTWKYTLESTELDGAKITVNSAQELEWVEDELFHVEITQPNYQAKLPPNVTVEVGPDVPGEDGFTRKVKQTLRKELIKTKGPKKRGRAE